MNISLPFFPSVSFSALPALHSADSAKSQGCDLRLKPSPLHAAPQPEAMLPYRSRTPGPAPPSLPRPAAPFQRRPGKFALPRAGSACAAVPAGLGLGLNIEGSWSGGRRALSRHQGRLGTGEIPPLPARTAGAPSPARPGSAPEPPPRGSRGRVPSRHRWSRCPAGSRRAARTHP